MATVFWLKGQTDWSLAGSWKTATAGAGTVPVSTDTVYIAEGSDEIVTGLANSAVDLTALEFTEGSQARIGSAGTSLTISCTGTVKFRQTGGFLFLTAGSANIASMIVKGTGGAQCYLTGGVFDSRIDISSHCRINDSAGLSGVILELNTGADVYVQYKVDATDPTVIVNGGSLRLERPALTITQNGGSVTVAVERETSATPAYVHNAGDLTWLRGSCASLISKGTGHVDFSKLVAPVTITDSTFGPNVKVTVHPLVTFTNASTLLGGRASVAGGPAPS